MSKRHRTARRHRPSTSTSSHRIPLLPGEVYDTADGLAGLYPCPHCPADVLLAAPETVTPLFDLEASPALLADAIAGWACHGCGNAGLVFSDDQRVAS